MFGKILLYMDLLYKIVADIYHYRITGHYALYI